MHTPLRDQGHTGPPTCTTTTITEGTDKHPRFTSRNRSANLRRPRPAIRTPPHRHSTPTYRAYRAGDDVCRRTPLQGQARRPFGPPRAGRAGPGGAPSRLAHAAFGRSRRERPATRPTDARTRQRPMTAGANPHSSTPLGRIVRALTVAGSSLGRAADPRALAPCACGAGAPFAARARDPAAPVATP